MSTPQPTQPWSDLAILRLRDVRTCPVCGADALNDHRCGRCGADLSGEIAHELWAASEAAATALTARQAVLARVPRRESAPRSADTVRQPAATANPASPSLNAVPRSSATVQSVLAVAGAGLFAVAAIVFTFFNPDLTDHVLRSIIVGLVTVLFLAGAWLLARRRLQFSAEAVGGLGMVFVALDVYAVSELSPTGMSPWVFSAIGTLLAGAVMIAVSMRARIRSWLWISLVGLAATPAMLGYAAGTTLVATVGHLGVAFAALALLESIPRLSGRFATSLTAERVTLTVLQITAITVVLLQISAIDAGTTTEYWVLASAVLVGVAVLAGFATRQLVPVLWSAVAGSAGVAAAVCLPFALDFIAVGDGEWYLAIAPAAGAIAVLVLGVCAPSVPTIRRGAFLSGAFAIGGLSVLPSVLFSVLTGVATVLSFRSDPADGPDAVAGSGMSPTEVFATVLGLAAVSIGLGAFSAITRRVDAARADTRLAGSAASPQSSALASVTGAFAVWFAALACLTLACLPSLPLWSRITVALGLAVATSVAVAAIPRIRSARFGVRLPLVLGAHFAVLLATISSWVDTTATVWYGPAVIAALVALALAAPKEIRFLHVGVGYAYALMIFATGLTNLSFGPIAVQSLTTALGSVGAIAATFIRRVRTPSWYAVLTVTGVPFVIGVIQVVFERSGWSALSTGLIFLLALTLLVTRRSGLNIGLRAVAAGLLVPSFAVVIICLGAQVLVASASPVTLPVIVAIVALVLPSTAIIRSALLARGLPEPDAHAARIAIESSALLTGAIAVALALVRVAAGLQTTFLVLLILGIGAAATSFWAKRRYGWWVAGAAFTGALWCQWAIAGVDVLEPYLLPPALAAAVIGVLVTARRGRGVPLFTTGLLVAVAPILVVLAAFGTGATALAPWRGYGLVTASWLLLGIGALFGLGHSERAARLRSLRTPTLAVAILAGAAGAIQGVRFGLHEDLVVTGGVPLIVACFGIAAAGALPSMMAARIIRQFAPADSRLARSRWLYAPGTAYLAVGTWCAIERNWFTIWAMWALLIGYLAFLAVIAWRSCRQAVRSDPALHRATGLPPVWFVFALAFVTAIVAWSPRELRVEWFSLPLGLGLLAAGVIALRGQTPRSGDALPATITPRGLNSWPARWTGSWPLLAPGTIVIMLASIIATFTDPLTWRAILVIVIALIAILIGSGKKLAAPFIIGVIVLPIENVFVFLVQIGRGIESMPWWITLAVVGAVLLIIAVTYERRAGDSNRFVARMRDLV